MQTLRVDVGEQAGLYKRSASGRYRTQTSISNVGSTVAEAAGEGLFSPAAHGRKLFLGAVSMDEGAIGEEPVSIENMSTFIEGFDSPNQNPTQASVDLSAPLNNCLRREDLMEFYNTYNPHFCHRVNEVLRQESVTAKNWLDACQTKYSATPKITAMTPAEIAERKRVFATPKKKSMFSERLDQCFQRGHGTFNEARKELHVAAAAMRGMSKSPRQGALHADKDKRKPAGEELLVGWGHSAGAPAQDCLSRPVATLGKVVFDCLQSCTEDQDQDRPRSQPSSSRLPTEEDLRNLQAALADYYRKDFTNTIIQWKRENPRHEDNYERFLYDKFPENIKTQAKAHLEAAPEGRKLQRTHGFLHPSFLKGHGKIAAEEDDKSGLNLDDEEEEMRRVVEESRLRCEQELTFSMQTFLQAHPGGDFLSFLEAEWPKDFAIYQRSQEGDAGMRRSYVEWECQFADLQARAGRAQRPGWNPTHTPKARGVIARRETFSDKEVTWVDKRVVNDNWKDVFMQAHSSDEIVELGMPPGVGDVA